MKINNKRTNKIVISALFLAIGFILPTLTMQIKEIGDTLLPMHVPVMLCGLVCGWKYGAAVGLCLPFLRSAVFGMPPLYPNAVWMSAELAAYGLVIGLVYLCFKKKNTAAVLISLVCAQLAGRVTWGVAKAALLGAGGKAFTVSMFVAGGFVDALPGIILQLVLIPTVMALLGRSEEK